MIVGTKKIDIAQLRRASKDITILRRYCENLIPSQFKHIPEILNNQKYLVALTLRGLLGMSFKRKDFIVEELLSETSITGVTHQFVDIEDLLGACDIDKLFTQLLGVLDERGT